MTSSTRLTTFTILDALSQAAAQLKNAGIDQAEKEARWLMAAHLDVDISRLWTLRDHDILVQPELFYQRLSQRCVHNPLSRIMGYRDFWKSRFYIADCVLDPRPDSEWLIEAACEFAREPCHIIDLGTGSGCLLLSLLQEFPHAQGIGLDKSSSALKIAAKNAQRLGLEERSQWLCSDWLDAYQEDVADIILANPPYIPQQTQLSRAVIDYDPPEALFAGDDGLDAYRALVPNMRRIMHQHSLVVFECGPAQTLDIALLLMGYDFRVFSPLAQCGKSLHPSMQIGVLCATFIIA